MWISSVFKAGIFNSDVKLQISLALLKCFETLVEGARTACTSGYVWNVFCTGWSSHVVSSERGNFVAFYLFIHFLDCPESD